MNKIINLFLVTLLSTFTSAVYSQNLHVNLFGGIANYKGDLQYNPKGGKQKARKS